MSPSVVEPTDGHVVAMSGAVNPGMVITLYRTIAAELDAGHRGIVIDLSAVTFLGAQTAGLFCGALRLLERRGAALEILGGPQPLQRILVAGDGTPRVTQVKQEMQLGKERAQQQAERPRTKPRTATNSPPQSADRPSLSRSTSMPEMTDAYQWNGRTMIGSDGEKIGKISEIYEDPQTGKPEWATVSSGLFGTKSNFVPLAGASPEGEDVQADVTKDQVKDAPGVQADGELSEQEERRLFEHYNVPYTTEGSTTAQGAPNGDQHTDGDRVEGRGQVGHDTSGPTTDDAMTRSEEELRVGTTQREAGRARLRKHVVTEMVTKTVPVQREEVRIEREPITDASRDQATSGADISEEEHEVVLHEDEVVVDKQTVAKERLRLGTETVTEDREVSEEVRKEQIETDGDTDTGRRNR